jgi:hypothetical protein
VQVVESLRRPEVRRRQPPRIFQSDGGGDEAEDWLTAIVIGSAVYDAMTVNISDLFITKTYRFSRFDQC